jgi:DNA-binding MarR family transcriptional regulator
MAKPQRKAESLLRSVSDDELLELDNQLCFALDLAARLIVKAYRPALTELGITHAQYLVLLVLWSWDVHDEPRPTVKALGERLALDSGTLTPLLKRLAAHGLITRARSTEDERELVIRLTLEGRALKKRARCVPRSLLKQSPISLAELVKLRDQLRNLRAALQTV